jgi:hypothetical protein
MLRRLKIIFIAMMFLGSHAAFAYVNSPYNAQTNTQAAEASQAYSDTGKTRWFIGGDVAYLFANNFARTTDGVSGNLPGGFGFFNARPRIAQNQVHFGAHAGIELTNNLLLYASYQHFGDYDYHFDTFTQSSGQSATTVDGKLNSQVFLANIDYQFRQFDEQNWIIPVLGVGAGVAVNRLGEGTEVTSFSVPYATIYANTTTNVAVQGRAGFVLPIASNIDINFLYKVTYVGDYQSSDKILYSFGFNNQEQTITPYAIKNVMYHSAGIQVSLYL